MTIQRSSSTSREAGRNWKRRQAKLGRETRRRLQLESLEPRQLMAVGPRLAGIQANDATLLREGQVRKIAPQELTFHFNDGANLDATTVANAIVITRAGGDGQFAKALGTTDFNTSGAVIMDFTAAQPGEAGNGITLNFIKNDLGLAGVPRITVLGDTINVELNSRVGSQTTAGQLRDALNANVDAKKLVTASLRNNGGVGVNIASPPINYSPVVTAGANAAFAVTNMNAGAGLQVRLTAVQAGPSGNGIEVVINRVNFGGVSPPQVTVVDRVITVNVNSNAASPSIAQEFADAINNHPTASGLVRVTVPVGNSNTAIGNRVNPGTRLRLAGTSDIPVIPGFVGLGATPRQVIVRFAESLPDDLYHVSVLGTGPFALRNDQGGAFGDETEDGVDNGVDFDLNFELDLGAQVLSVVPQPITRNPVSNTLLQARNQIHVYYNDDDLWPFTVLTGQLATNPTVVDPAFYQLAFTDETATNTDDVVYRPTAIQYDPATDIAVLQFAQNLDELGSGPGTFRLRIGTDEAIPLPPVATALSDFAQVTSDFRSSGAVTVLFQQVASTATPVTLAISKRDLGEAGAPVVTVSGTAVSLELNSRPGSESTAAQVVAAVNGAPATANLISAALFSSPATANVNVAATLTTPQNLTLQEVGSSFDSALNLAVLTNRTQILNSSITAQPYDLAFPGAIDEPGHRDLPPEIQQHFLSPSPSDAVAGTSPPAFYNFQDEYGFDPNGNILHNAITENQKQRAREVFSLYSQYLGIQFIETDNLGMTIVTGDLRAIDVDAVPGPGGVLGIAAGGLIGTAIMDVQDFSGTNADLFGGSWFLTAMHEIGHLLGLGHTDELPPQTILNQEDQLAFPENTVEPVFPGDADILHGQHVFRPDSNDIDLYRFDVRDAGRLSIETFAERLESTSLLDTTISLYRQNSNGQRQLIARNDDYFSNDSFLELDVSPGVYWVGVSASGNDRYDPTITDTGLGGRSDGDYELRLNLRPDSDRSILDATGVEFDGNGDGVPGGVFNYWFRAQDVSHSLFVDKAASVGGTGSIGSPFQLISSALAAAQPGDIVRILGNPGADGNLATLADNLAYEIGFNQLGQSLSDGASFDVPQGVTVMIDAGAILKVRRARIGVGSSSQSVDRSGAALQVLGAPVQLDTFGFVVRDVDGNVVPGSVYFTSLHDDEIGLGRNPDSSTPDAAQGDWGGIDYRRDIDAQDVNRFDYERVGIFLNHVAQADMRFGGGTVLVDGIPQVISPVNMVSARPTVMYSRISESADAALAASPDSFEETNFHSPLDQRTPFTSDYSRVGPDIHGNRAVDNSINGLFVRVETPGGGVLQPLTVAGRWDDTDIPHVLAERLVVRGTAGGQIFEADSPPVELVTLTASGGGELPSGQYHYRVVFVDADGNESVPSDPTDSLTIDGTTAVRTIDLDNLPLVPANFATKRVYRSDPSGDGTRPYSLVAELNATSTVFSDTGGDLGTRTRTLVVPVGTPPVGVRPRLDARLAIDPGVIVKLNGGAIETTFGADFYAEGLASGKVIFTSGNDDRYGGGGTFDTTDNADRTAAQPGDWGGIFLGHATRGSIDHAVIAFGGGSVNIEGGFSSFNAVEVHQSPARVTHSLFERNASGFGNIGAPDRAGRGFNRDAVIFARGSQPVIVDNTMIDNQAPVISIDASSLNAVSQTDYGRSTVTKSGRTDPIAIVDAGSDNQGPLIRQNRLDRNLVNGMQVRGATLTTEGVWDDTDIVHVLRNETVYVPDFHSVGGLRLESSAAESLVVKLEGTSAGFTATGRPLDIDDRIGGSVHVVGQPNHPVVMTSIEDCTVGAGFTPNGEPQNDTVESDACGPLGTPTSFVDVIVVMDESGSMAFAQQFSVQLINDLENALLAAGIGSSASGGNRYGLVGFGGSSFDGHEPGHAHPVGANGALFGTAAEYGIATTSLTDLGAFEDGYDGIQFALDNYAVRPEASKFMLMVTNEDRDILSPQYTFATTLAGLNSAGFILQTILSASIQSATGQSALGIDANSTVFLEDGQGGFTTSPNGSITPFFDTAVTDYANMAFATAGVAGDINQIQAGGLTATSFSNVIASSVVVRAGGGNPARPGDWNSLRLDKYSNDRNVATTTENEGPTPADGVGNGTPTLAQFVGALAPHEKAGDENLRLGIEVHGGLNQRGDADVYSFKGTAGSEIWIDIDDTRNSLDTVVELIDANGVVLARSNDSTAETADPSLLFRSPGLAAGTVQPLRKAGYDPMNPSRESIFAIDDQGTTNPRDAGLRVVLPGSPGVTATYHVRVRSNGPDLSKLDGGLTLGNYLLQLRLREQNEQPGSSVQYSDIRYATNGIEVLGQPTHSPLTGEAREVEVFSGAPGNNGTQATAQPIGNVLQTDRGAISLQGNIDIGTDVDFYQVTVNYDSIQGAGPLPHASLIFDIDYADGLARPNSTLWVFDSQGRLILRGTGSNIAEDRAAPLSGAGMTDLARGSVGPLDPYVGPVEMPASNVLPDGTIVQPQRGTYFVAVTSNSMTAEVLQQYLQANVPAGVESIRLEPVNSLRRIAEDRIGSSGESFTAQPPVVPVLIDPAESPVPHHLGDVTLFVTQDVGLAPQTISTLNFIDPFTGAPEATAGSFAQPIADVAMRGDGNLFAYTIGPDNFQGNIQDTTTGAYVQINTGTGATTVISADSDGVETNIQDPMNAQPAAIRPNNGNGVGMEYRAMTFVANTNTALTGYAVGTRNDGFNNSPAAHAAAGVDYLENILYNFDINTGIVANSPPGAANRTGVGLLDGAGTQRIEVGEILTYTRITPQNPSVGDIFRITINGKTIEYTAGGGFGFASVQEVVAGLAAAWVTAALTVPEFNAFEVLNNTTFPFETELRVRLRDAAAADFQIQTSVVSAAGFSFADLAVDGFGPGGIVTGIASFDGGFSFYAVTDRGGLYQVSQFPTIVVSPTGVLTFSNNLATYVRGSAVDLMTADNGQPIQFAGLARGPANVENGKYADTLFGISVDGDLYAFDTNGELQPVFFDNQTSVSTGLFAVNGLAFSTLDRNLWTTTGNRGTDLGHGFDLSAGNDEPFDGSRLDTQQGGTSLYFGNDAFTGGNQAFQGTRVRNYDFPGGAYGSVISNPFSLKGYTAADLPVLYFNYFLGTEDTDFVPVPNTPTRDTLRVFASGDDGDWVLLATNDLFQNAVFADEFDFGPGDTQCGHPLLATEPCVQRLFDNTGQWRQARIPLGALAGQDNLRLRFDFSTAGEMHIGDTFTVGSELRAISGAALRDGQTFTLDNTNTLEFDLGFTLVAPNGAGIQDGNSFTVTSGARPPVTFEFDSDGFFARNIAAAAGNQFRDGETFLVRVGSQTEAFEFNSGVSLQVPATGGGLNGLRNGDRFEIDGVDFEFDTDGVFTAGNVVINLIVDNGLRVPAAGGAAGGLVDGDRLTINSGLGAPDVIFEFDSDRPSSVTQGARPVDLTNIELHVPIAGGGFGGISDGDSFAIGDGMGGPDVVFEFDKNNSVASGNRVISITDQSTQDEVADAIVIALQISGLQLKPVNQGGGVIRLGVFRHSVDTSGAPRLGSQVIPATQDEVAERLADSILNSGLGLTPTHVGAGLIRLGSTTYQVNVSGAPTLRFELVPGSQDQVANLIVDAIRNTALTATPVNLGGGEVALGRNVNIVDVTNAPTLAKLGSADLNDPAAAAVLVSPIDNADQVATAIATAINGAGLGITATTNQNVVNLPSNTLFSPNNTALTPDGVRPVTYSALDSPSTVADNMETAIRNAFASTPLTADLTVEGNDTLATAIDAGLTGGPADFQAAGFVGDNLSFGLQRGLDVDLVRLDLQAGEHVTIDATVPNTSSLIPGLRLFDANGVELATTNQSLTFNPFNLFNLINLQNFNPFLQPSTIDFQVVTSGTYYVGVSSSANFSYNPNSPGSADIVVSVPAAGGAIGGLTDGESFSITVAGGNPVVFEFDSDGNVRPSSNRIRLNDVLMQVPAVGAGPGGIRDGDTFVINDNRGSGDVRFEFDTDFNFNPANIPIFLFSNSPAIIAQQIAFEVQNANLGLNPTALGNGAVVLGTTTHTVDATGTPALALSTLPRTQAQIAASIQDSIRNARLGILPVLDPFTNNVVLDIVDQFVDATLAPNLTLITPSNTGDYDLTVQIENPFDLHANGNRLNLEGVTNVTRTGLSTNFIDGSPGTSVANRTPVKIHSDMTSAEVAQAIAEGIGRSTTGYVKQIVAPPGASMSDGEIFAIGDGTTTVNFEIENGYSLQLPNLALDPNAYLDGESFSISSGTSLVTFEFDNDGTFVGGNTPLRFNDLMLQVPLLGGLSIQDGDTIAVDQNLGTPPDIFEFDFDGVVQPGSQSIPLTVNSTQNDVANAIVLALRNANVGLSPVNRGQGQVQVGLTTQTVDISSTPSMTRRTILLTQNEMADKVSIAIRDAGLGLTPSNLGGGLVHLGGTAGQQIDVSDALGVQVIGSPGARDPNAVLIPVFPSVATSAAQVSQLLQSAISTAVALRGLNVTATPDGARRINLQANSLLAEFSNAPSITLNDSADSVKVYDNIVKVIGHTVTNRGPLGLENSLAGDQFGAFNASGPPNISGNFAGALRGMDNSREGAYIDDIVIGFAERGEMITGSSANTNFVPNNELLNPALPVGLVPHREVEIGPYQLEVRRAEAFGTSVVGPIETFFSQSFDSNDRLSNQASLTASPGNTIADGHTLSISDGLKSVTFEFEDLDLNNGVTSGRIAIGYRTAESDVVIARRIRDVINGSQVQALLKVTAALSDGTATGTTSTSNRVDLFGNAVVTVLENAKPRSVNVTEPNDTLTTAVVTGIGTADVTQFTGTGTIGDNTALPVASSDVDLFEVHLDAGQQLTIDVTATPQLLSLDGVLRVFDATGQELAFNDDTLGLNPHLDFIAPARGTYFVGVSGFFNFFYSPQFAGSGSFFGPQFSTGPYVITMVPSASGIQLRESSDFGDQNIVRDQGQILIDSSRISHSIGFGILVDAGSRDGALGVNAPHQGPTRLTRELNSANLVPGVSLANNVIFRSGTGGIRYSGEVATVPDPNNPGATIPAPVGAIPFGRIVNNTIVGGPVGIVVDENASPTILNNILSSVTTGINVDPSSPTTVVGGTVFQNVTTPTVGTSTGTFPITLSASDPLFVNADVDNFYLEPGSLAIDSSVNSVQDRPALVAVKSPLGIGPSPILAPDLDALGQVRVDDPAVNTPPGLGGNVFKDRGAIDRADFNGPTAVMLVPVDNDPQNRDVNRGETFIELTNTILTNFSIQIRDGLAPTDPREGTGADDNTVRGDRVTLFRDGEKLIQGLDYSFHYDATNNIIRLTPLAGIWELDRQYDIVLSNSKGVAITAPAGNTISDGDTFQVTDVTGKMVEFEFDSGYVMTIPRTLALQIPTTGGAGITDGELFTISDGVRTERFEFDSNGANENDNVPPPSQPTIVIPFTLTDSANEIANRVVTAIRSTSLDLSPVNVINPFGRAVHLGSKAGDAVNNALSPSVVVTGVAAGIEDGQTFSIDDGTKVVTFEFVEGIGGAGAGNRAINFTHNQTNDQIADAVVAAVIAAGVNLNPSHHENSDGLIHLGGTTRHVVANIDSQVVISGLPGVRPAWSLKIPTVGGQLDFNLITDGEVFVVTNGATSVTFELDDDGVSTPGNRIIPFTSNTTTTQLANAVAIAIRNANLGLSPTNAGGGFITLGGTVNHSVDLTASSFSQLGLPGVPAAEPVPFIPGDFFTPNVPARTPIFSAEQVAQSIANAINNARIKTLFDKSVVATAQNDEVQVEGVDVGGITGITNVFQSNITDVAGNSLKPTRPDGTTKFTIFVGSGLDYGDAPAPYPTQDASNGARHMIVGDFILGDSIDTDFDGQPSTGANGDDLTGLDDEDGVVVTEPFVGGYGGAITVTASASGLLDAWVDFNQDGDWSDAGEQVFASRQLVAGENPLPVTVAGTAKPGPAVARFRFSSKGGLAPTGFAEDGEVEDYRINITGNPWRNPSNGLDVDASGFVVPQDALIVINALNAGRGGPLPRVPVPPFTPPPFVDANGDAFLSPSDVLAIINFLNNRPAAGEGESASNGMMLVNAAGSMATANREDAAAADMENSWLAGGVLFVDHRLGAVDRLESEPALEGEWEWSDETDQVVLDVAADGASHYDRHSSDLASALALADREDVDEQEADLLDLLAGDIDEAWRTNQP